MIISKKIAFNLLQKDGSRNVREVHVDDIGQEYIFDYVAPVGMDIDARLASRIVEPTPPYIAPVDEVQVLKDKIITLETKIVNLTKQLKLISPVLEVI